MNTEQKALYRAGVRLFGTWSNAVNSSGINYEKNVLSFEHWKKDTIINAIKKIGNSNQSLSSHDVQRNYRALYVAACKHIGSWSEAVTLSGFDYNVIRKNKPWKIYTKDQIINQIKSWALHDEPLNTQYMLKKHPNFEAQARRRFGSWEKTLQAAGINYDSIRLAATNEILRGLQFESIVKDFFSNEKPHLIFHKRIYVNKDEYLIPDFIDMKNNIWYDCKVRCWSIGAEDSITKYEPYAREIHIIYLFGKSPSNYGKVKFFNIFQIVSEKNDQNIYNKLTKLREATLKELSQKRKISRVSISKKIRAFFEKDGIVQRKKHDWENTSSEVLKISKKIGRFPTSKELTKMGKQDVWTAIQYFGGAYEVAEKLGIVTRRSKPGFYKEFNQLKNVLLPLCKKLGRFPTKRDLKNENLLYLKPHIQYHGGPYKLARELGYTISVKQSKYWNDIKNIRKEILSMSKNGMMPSHEQFLKAKKLGLYGSLQKHGGIYAVAKKLNLIPYRDKNEQRNWEYVQLEIGMHKKKLGKFPTLRYLETKGTPKLLTLITTHYGGMHKVADKLGEKMPMRPPGYWSFERVKEELLIINKNIGHLPSRGDLRNLDREDLIDPIKIHGGIKVIAGKLGLSYSSKWPKRKILK